MSIYLNKFNDLPLNQIMDKPIELPKCHLCEEPTENVRLKYVENDIKVCRDCFSELHSCNYCSNRAINTEHGICKSCLHNSASVLPYSEKPYPIFHRIKHQRVSKPPLLTEKPYYPVYKDSTGTQRSRHFPVHFG